MFEIEVDVKDRETGEVKRSVFREVEPTRRKPRDKDFHRMRPEALKKLINSELSAADFKVLLTLCLFCTWTNRVQVVKKDIVVETGLSEKAVYNSLTKLHILQFIHFPNGTTRGVCFIDPEICWRGYTEQLAAAATLYRGLWADYALLGSRPDQVASAK